MVLNRFFLNVLIRVVLIVLSSLALGIVAQQLDHGYYYTLAGVISLLAIQSWLLLNQVNKTNTDLEKFFSSVQDQDSSFRFSESKENNTFRKLHDRMNRVNTILKNVKIENEKTSQFLQSVVDHVDIGLLSFDSNGRIEIFNKAASRYLKCKHLQQLSFLETIDIELYKSLLIIKPGQDI